MSEAQRASASDMGRAGADGRHKADTCRRSSGTSGTVPHSAPSDHRSVPATGSPIHRGSALPYRLRSPDRSNVHRTNSGRCDNRDGSSGCGSSRAHHDNTDRRATRDHCGKRVRDSCGHLATSARDKRDCRGPSGYHGTNAHHGTIDRHAPSGEHSGHAAALAQHCWLRDFARSVRAHQGRTC